MSDRYNSISVVLEENLNEQQVAHLESAIEAMRGVLQARANIAGSEAYIADERAKRLIIEKVYKALRDL